MTQQTTTPLTHAFCDGCEDFIEITNLENQEGNLLCMFCRA